MVCLILKTPYYISVTEQQPLMVFFYAILTILVQFTIQQLGKEQRCNREQSRFEPNHIRLVQVVRQSDFYRARVCCEVRGTESYLRSEDVLPGRYVTIIY